MDFTKMQGTGNDFIVVDGINNDISKIQFSNLAPSLCNRYFGIGADGIICVLPSTTADVRMRIYNADGSEAEMCGNGLRCLSLYAFHHNIILKKKFSVQTGAGIIKPEILDVTDTTARVRVNMGTPAYDQTEPEKLDLLIRTRKEDVNFIDRSFYFMPISMGNPHAVIQVPDTDNFPVREIGPLIENHSRFPEKTNVEFMEIVSDNEVNMRVWERGSGETLACGTGACATVVAGILLKKLTPVVTVHLRGGDLLIEWSKKKDVFLTGDTVLVYTGSINLNIIPVD